MIERAVRIVIGLAALVYGLRSLHEAKAAGDIGAGIGSLFLFGACCLVALICLLPYVTEFVSGPFGSIFGSGSGMRVRADYSVVNGMLANREYHEAVAELRAIIEKAPTAADARLMLASTLYEKLNDAVAALAEINAALGLDGKWDEDHSKLLMLAVDIHLDQGQQAEASTLLETHISRIPNNLKDAAQQRLSSLRG